MSEMQLSCSCFWLQFCVRVHETVLQWPAMSSSGGLSAVAAQPSPTKGLAKSVAGDVQTIVRRAVGTKAGSFADLRQSQDLDHLIDSFSTTAADLVSDLATLMRAGTLRKAIAKVVNSADGKGRELAASRDTLRGLRDCFLRRYT